MVRCYQPELGKKLRIYLYISNVTQVEGMQCHIRSTTLDAVDWDVVATGFSNHCIHCVVCRNCNPTASLNCSIRFDARSSRVDLAGFPALVRISRQSGVECVVKENCMFYVSCICTNRNLSSKPKTT